MIKKGTNYLLRLPEESIYYKIHGYRNFENLLRDTKYRIFDPYLKETHLKHLSLYFLGKCYKDEYFREFMVDKIMDKLFLNNSSDAYNLMRNTSSHYDYIRCIYKMM